MRRRLFTLSSGVSGVLCAAIVALWVRGYWAGTSFDYLRNQSRLDPDGRIRAGWRADHCWSKRGYVAWAGTTESAERQVPPWPEAILPEPESEKKWKWDFHNEHLRRPTFPPDVPASAAFPDQDGAPGFGGDSPQAPEPEPEGEHHYETQWGFRWAWAWRRVETKTVPDSPRGDGLQGRRVEWRSVVPCWLLASPWAILPATWLFVRYTRRRRQRRGCCPACGYDLRATPGRCPECGAAQDATAAVLS